MWMRGSNSSSSVCTATPRIGVDTNNSRYSSIHSMYQAPEKPELQIAYVPADLTPTAVENREAFQRARQNFVHLWFRVRKSNYDQVLWQLLSTGEIGKNQAYDSENLRYWTIGMRVKIKNHLPMGRVMDAIKCRLGAKCPGIKFCLDGFFGMRDFSDIFNCPEACPWMEISNFSTVVSLRLKHGDNIFISVASPAQIADVVEWRRKKALIVKEPQSMDTSSPSSMDKSGESEERDQDGTVIGKIAYDSRILDELM